MGNQNGEKGWLVEDWLPVGHKVMDTSGEGNFKTMTGCYLSVCVASGDSFLGKNVRQGPVLIVDKETERKLRWGKEIGETTFSLYIPKWRVPKPWPKKIYVDIEPAVSLGKRRKRHTRADAQRNKELNRKPITAMIRSLQEHTKTLRYQPLGHGDDWDIGEPYIPYELTHDSSEYLQLTVNWVK